MQLIGRVGEPDAHEVVEGEGEALAVADGGDHRDGEGGEEEDAVEEVRHPEAEEEGGDAKEDRDAVEDVGEHPGIAVVALVRSEERRVGKECRSRRSTYR